MSHVLVWALAKTDQNITDATVFKRKRIIVVWASEVLTSKSTAPKENISDFITKLILQGFEQPHQGNPDTLSAIKKASVLGKANSNLSVYD